MSEPGYDTRDEFWQLLLAAFVPPVGVYLHSGFGRTLLINAVLTMLFFVPGTLHAVWVIVTQDEDGRTKSEGTDKLFFVFLCLILPPGAVFFHRGLSGKLLLNLVLTLVFYAPGVVHALWVVTQYPRKE